MVAKKPSRWSRMTEAQRDVLRASQRRWAARNRDKQHASKTKSRHGVNAEQYAKMLAEQGGLCAICKKRETKLMNGNPMRLCVDHDHETEQTRELLCSRCNAVLGLVYDDDLLLEAMAWYLRKHRME